MRQTLRIAAAAAMLALIAGSCFAQEKLSRRERRQFQEQQMMEELMETISGRSFSVDIHTVTHATNGSQIDLDGISRKPEVLFRADGIHFSIPYFTGSVPMDGIVDTPTANANMPVTGTRHSYNAQVYPQVWLDWSCPYPADYEVTEGKGKVTVKFTTDMGSGDRYLCEFVFSRKNCDFTVWCKSFTKTQYRGHLVEVE